MPAELNNEAALVRIAMNETVTKLRRRYAPTWVALGRPEDADEETSPTRDIQDWRHNPEESYSKTVLRTILSKAFQGLDTPLRVVFVLRDIEGLSCEDTARVLELSIPTVKSRLIRACLMLRRKLSFLFEDRSALATR